MKRTSKIITVIVMLTLLMAAFVVVASALNTSDTSFMIGGKELNKTGAENTIYVKSVNGIQVKGSGDGYFDLDIYKGIQVFDENNQSNYDFILNTNSYSKRTKNNTTYTAIKLDNSNFTEGSYTIAVTYWKGNGLFDGGTRLDTNIYYYHFVLDTTAPIVTLNGVSNGGTTNENVNLTWTEGGYSAKIDGGMYDNSTYNNGAVISEEGTYTITVTDLAGNNTERTFTIDKTAPTWYLKNPEGTSYVSGATLGSAYFTWTEENCTAIIDGGAYKNAVYNKGTFISTEGTYKITLTDKNGNSTFCTFTIDKTPPKAYIKTLSGKVLDNNDVTGESVFLDWDEYNVSAVINGEGFSYNKKYDKKQIIEGINGKTTTYSITIKDRFDNANTYTFSINKKLPTLTIYDKNGTTRNDGALSPDGFYFKWGDDTDAGICEVVYQNLSVEGSGEKKYLQHYYYFDTDEYGNHIPYTNKSIATSAIIAREKAKIQTAIWVENESYQLSDGTIVVPVKTHDTFLLGDACYVYEGHVFKTEDAANTYITDTAPKSIIEIKKNILTEEGEYEVTITSTYNSTSVKYKVTIDRTAPTGTLTTSQEGDFREVDGKLYTNGTVTFTYTDGDAKIGATTYISGTAIVGAEGENNEYRIILTDAAGNSTTYAFFIYKKNPEGTLKAGTVTLENNCITNQDVKLTWANENSFIATLDGEPYKKETDVSTAGTHTFTLTDEAGNCATYIVQIDTTEPTGTLTTSQEGGFREVGGKLYTNGTVTFTYTDGTATLDGTTYASGTTFTIERDYVLYLTDAAGNRTEYLFTIDATAPEGTLWAGSSELENGGFTNKNVVFNNWNEYATAIINGGGYENSTYEVGTRIQYTDGEDVTYTITLFDAAGNSSVYSFTIDRTKPVGDLVGVENGGYTNDTVYFTWEDASYSLFMGNSEIIGVLQPDGSYRYEFVPEENEVKKIELKLYDAAGNETEYSFTLDTVAPNGTLEGSFNSDNRTKSNVALTWTEATATAKINGGTYDNATYDKGTAINVEGSYVITLYDRAGNSTEFRFEIDKTAPQGELINVDNGGATNKFVKFKWTEIGCSAFLDDVKYIKNAEISAEGSHTIVLVDDVGNKTEYSFTIDKTAPVGSLLTKDSPLENNCITKETVTFKWSETKVNVKLDGIDVTNGDKKITVSEEGTHNIVIIDIAGNETEYSFTIDVTPPEGALWADGALLTSGGSTNKSVYLTWEGDYYHATLGGNEYSKGTVLTEEGSYELKLYDEAGNCSTYTVNIDRTKPIGELWVGSTKLDNGGITKNDVSFKWNEGGCTAIYNENTYTDKVLQIVTHGTHTVTLFDAAGNSSVYSFTIDREPANITFSTNYNELDDKLYFKNDFSASWSKEGCTATLDSAEYSKGTLISAEGTYVLTVTDGAGNKVSYTLVLDKTAPTNNRDYFQQNGKSNPAKWFETYYYSLDGNRYINGGYYAFSNEKDAIDFAKDREYAIVEQHSTYYGGTIICNWAGRAVDGYDVANNADMLNNTYSIYFDINNKNRLIAYFNAANLTAAVEHYASKSIKEKFLPSTPALAYPGSSYSDAPAQNLSRNIIYIKSNSSYQWKYINATLYVNDNLSDYKTPLSVGYHKIKEIDEAGNETEYVVVIDNSAPGVNCTDAAGNELAELKAHFASLNTVYASQVFTFSPNDNFDALPLTVITLDGADSYIIGGSYTFGKSGVYTIKMYDVAGNNVTYTLYVSLDTPTISAEDKISSSGTSLGKNITIDKILSFNKILSLTISKYNYEQSSWDALATDSNGKLIAPESLEYFIGESGRFKITVTDNFGRTEEKELEIYKDAPVGLLYTANEFVLASGSSTQLNVYFTWEDKTCRAYIIDGEKETLYTSGSYFTKEGFYTIKLVDLSNVSSIYTFYIDRTAPASTLEKATGNSTFTELSNGGFSNSAVKITWSVETEAGTTATFTKNGSDISIPYTNGSLFTEDGTYKVTLTDRAENTRSYTFTIDRTVAVVSILDSSNNTLSHGALTNKTVSFNWTESGCTATLNGNPYTSGTAIRESGTYSFYIEDKYGNYAYYTVTVDKIAPQGALVGASDGGITNGNVSLSWSEANCSATLNGEPYSSGAELSSEGRYELKLYDAAQNVTVYSFEIDKTAPQGELVGVTNGGYTNKRVYLTWNESGATATMAGNKYASQTSISQEGFYVIVLKDRAGNETEYSFTIDVEAPIGELIGAEDKGFTNNDVVFVWHESGCTATLDGEPCESGASVSAEGAHTFTLTDLAGNTSIYSFQIDKTAPEGYFSRTGTQLGSMYVFSKTVSFTWTESNLTATLDGADYTKGKSISQEGIYRLELRDRANNVSTYVFEIDFAKPEYELIGDFVIFGGKYYFKEAFSFEWEEQNCSATLDGNEYESGDLISDEGTYFIVLTDTAGNTSEITAVLDKTTPAPTFSKSYVTVGEIMYFKSSFNVDWKESNLTATLNDVAYNKGSNISEEKTYTLIISDVAGNVKTYAIVLDKTAPEAIFGATYVNNFNTLYFKDKVSISWSDAGVKATLNDAPLNNGSVLSVDGIYSLSLTDRAGNSTTYSLVLDTVAPVGELVGVANGGICNSYVSFKWSEAGCRATLNGNEYKKGTNIYSPDSYEICLYDVAGNRATYTFIIDYVVPEGTLNGVAVGGYTNGNVFFTWEDTTMTATLDGAAYNKGALITAEGAHVIVLTSEAGNSKEYSFTIDKTAPEGSLTGVENGGVTKSSVLFKWSEAGCTATLNGEDFKKDSYVYAEGVYTLVLKDKSENVTTYTFTIDKTAPEGVLSGVENGGITNVAVTLSWNEIGCTATINGVAYENATAISEEGSYELKLYDKAGNCATYTVQIDKTAPQGELIGVENGGVTSGSVYLKWTEMGATATLGGEEYISKTYLSDDNSYEIILKDRAGNTTVYSFIIDTATPEGTLSGVTEGGFTNNSVFFTWTEDGCTATLNGEPYENGTEISEEKTYTIVLTDAPGNMKVYTFSIDRTAPQGELVGVLNNGITNAKVKFNFARNYTATLNGFAYVSGTEISEQGSYELKLYDEANNVTLYLFEIDKTAPVGSFSETVNTVNGINYYPNDVYFTWDEQGITATLNGADYVFGSLIAQDGSYTLIINDLAHNSTVYEFVIDTTAPSTELVGVTNGGYTNSKVSVKWSEAHASATLNGNNYISGTSISEQGRHSVIVSDAIGNNTYITFTIDATSPAFCIGENPVSQIVLKEGSSFTVTPVDEYLKVFTFNGTEYAEAITLNSAYLNDGEYELVAEDLAGNITKIPVIVNKTAPVIVFSDTYVTKENGNFFTKSTKFSWDEQGITATLNGEIYKKNDFIYSEGSYTLVLTDNAGNTTTFSFTILKQTATAPLTALKDDATTETLVTEQGKNYNSYTPMTVNLVAGYTVYVNDVALTENLELSAPGVYKVKTENAAGVSLEYTVTIQEPAVEENESSVNGADIALIVIGSGGGCGAALSILKSFFKKKKLKIKRI